MKNIYTFLVLALFAFTTQAQIDRSVMPKPGPSPEINLEEPQQFELKNGLKVLVVENHKLPRVSIQLKIDNSPILEAEKAGVSSLTGSLLGNGSKTISKDEFNEEVDFLGARLSFGPQSAFASSLSKYFPRILELMADAAINPNFTEEEFQKEKQKLITGLKNQEKDVSSIARRVENALAYGKKHPYGEFTTEETVNNVTLADIKKFYSNYFVPANTYLVIIGDIKFDDVKKLVKKNFTPWTKAIAPSFQFSNPANVQYTQINFVDMPNAVQSEITVENLVDLKMSAPDYLPALIANKILGGGGEARLFLNLREDKGYTYGSYSRLGNNKHVSAKFRASASVRNMVTDSSVVEILKEIDSIRKTPVTAKELKDAKAKYVGNFVLALEKPQTIANYALNIETQGLSNDFYKTYLERINAITLEDVQKAAQKYFSIDNARIVITGKGSEVLSNLEKVTFKEKTIPIFYYNKLASKIDKPSYDTTVAEGVTVQSILDNYYTAIGGLDKLKAITSFHMEAGAEMQGMKLDLFMKKTTKNQFFQEINVMGNSMSKQVLNGDKGYMVIQGQKKELGENEMKKISTESAPFPEINYDTSTIVLDGVEDIDGKKAYKLKISDEKTSLFDAESGLKLQDIVTTEMQGQKMTSTFSYDDYKEVTGIKIPFILSQTMGPQRIDFTVKEIKLNEGVSDADFE